MVNLLYDQLQPPAGPVPDQSVFRLGLGLECNERDAESIEACRRVLAPQPDHPEANFKLGLLLGQNGMFEEAEVVFRRVVDRCPGWALALNNPGAIILW